MKEREQRHIFSEWLNEHRGLLFKVIKAYAFNREDQNDLFQETCLQVYLSIPNFKKKAAISTWLYRIAINTAIKWSAREKKHVDGHQEIEHLTNLLEAGDEAEDERVTWLYSAIKHLNEIDRSLTLLMLAGYNYTEIAEMTGISESNVGVKIHRIKKQLVNQSKQYEYDGI